MAFLRHYRAIRNKDKRNHLAFIDKDKNSKNVNLIITSLLEKFVEGADILMHTVETILDYMNRREYSINPYYVKRMLKATIKEGNKLKDELVTHTESFGVIVDFANNREVIVFINQTLLGREAIKGKTISNTILEELYVETHNPFFQTLIKYRRERERYTKVTSFIKNVIDLKFNKNDKNSVKEFCNKEEFERITIKPTAKVNASGGISLSNPSLPFRVDDVKNILGYNVAIPCKNMEEVLYVINKYRDLIQDWRGYMVIGNILYAEMDIDSFNTVWMPFDEGYEEYVKLTEEFQREFGVDCYGNKIKEEPKQEEKREDELEEVKTEKIYFEQRAEHVAKNVEKWNAMFTRLNATKNV
jgi:hypothetical protein